MGTGLQGNGQVSDSLSKIIFLVDPKSGKIAFSATRNVKKFLIEAFGTDDLFHQTLHSKNREISSEWLICMQVQPGEEHSFQHAIDEKNELVVTAAGLGEEDGRSGMILFTISPTETEETLAQQLKSLKLKHAEFIDHAAHDLHSPLRKLALFVEKFLGLEEGSQKKKMAEKIGSSISSMQRIIDEFTELARANEAGMHFTVTKPEQIVKDLVEEMSEEIGERKITVEVSPLPEIEGDPMQLRELFKNLLENSIKFSKIDVPNRIKIFPRPLEKAEWMNGKVFAEIVVEDNGTGFDPEYAEKIFEPFRRVHSGHGIRGNGLGLTICKRIVKNHHGRIFAESDGSNGASFVLNLPIPDN